MFDLLAVEPPPLGYADSSSSLRFVKFLCKPVYLGDIDKPVIIRIADGTFCPAFMAIEKICHQ